MSAIVVLLSCGPYQLKEYYPKRAFDGGFWAATSERPKCCLEKTRHQSASAESSEDADDVVDHRAIAVRIEHRRQHAEQRVAGPGGNACLRRAGRRHALAHRPHHHRRDNRKHALENAFTDSSLRRRTGRHLPADVFTAKDVTEDGVSVSDRVRMRQRARVVDVPLMLTAAER